MPQCQYYGHWLLLMLYADKDGVFDLLKISPDCERMVVETDLG